MGRPLITPTRVTAHHHHRHSSFWYLISKQAIGAHGWAVCRACKAFSLATYNNTWTWTLDWTLSPYT